MGRFERRTPDEYARVDHLDENRRKEGEMSDAALLSSQQEDPGRRAHALEQAGAALARLADTASDRFKAERTKDLDALLSIVPVDRTGAYFRARIKVWEQELAAFAKHVSPPQASRTRPSHGMDVRWDMYREQQEARDTMQGALGSLRVLETIPEDAVFPMTADVAAKFDQPLAVVAGLPEGLMWHVKRYLR